MITIYSDAHLSHNPPYEIYDGVLEPYAEKAERAEAIIKAVRQQKLGPVIRPKHFPLEHIYKVHQRQYVDFLQRRSEQLTAESVLYPSYFISDTYAPVTAGTYRASLVAVDCALTGAEQILGGTKAIYSLCRPPGHHAAHHTMGGYCYFNNAAIAAEFLAAYGKVAILDVDFHHGNGTQDAFYARNDVLYVSIHADPAQRYPYSSGFASEQGIGRGKGYTYNHPLPLNVTDNAYLKTLQMAIAEVKDFDASFLVVSVGFDTFTTDPIGGFKLTKSVYPNIARQIQVLGLHTLLIQEGGYDVVNLGEIAISFLTGFNGNGLPS